MYIFDDQIVVPVNGIWPEFWKTKSFVNSYKSLIQSFSLSIPWPQKWGIFTKFLYLLEDYSTNISKKVPSKYLQWYSNKSQF